MRRRASRISLDLPGLVGAKDIFRLCGGLKRSPAVDTWLAGRPHELQSIARAWFARMRECGADVRELIHDGCPVACVGDAPFGYVNVFKNHVNVGFFQGAALEDRSELLQGSGKRMRHVKLIPGRDFDAAALGGLIGAAYADVRVRLGVEPTSRKR